MLFLVDVLQKLRLSRWLPVAMATTGLSQMPGALAEQEDQMIVYESNY